MPTFTTRPTSDSATALTPSAEGSHYPLIDETSKDETDYVAGVFTGAWQTDIYGFTNHSSESGSISSVVLKYYTGLGAAGSYTAIAKGAIKIGSTTYYGSEFTPPSSVTLHSDTWNTNPATSAAWTWSEIDDLLAGVSLYSTKTDWSNFSTIYVYQLWVEVNYTPIPDAPTNVSATENDGSKVVVTWTKSTGATGYKVYRDGDDASGLLGDVATYDDTTAAAPVITAGTATASDGTYDDKVSFSLSGNSIADGTKYTYTVKATSDGTNFSSASSSDTGYRKAQSVSYQWQKSSGDASFVSFADISGKTSSFGEDTDIPANGLASPYEARYYKVKVSATGFADVYSTVDHGCRDAGGRYYKCKLSATGSTTVYSTSDRGYRAEGVAISFIQEIMRVFYTP